MPKLACMLDLWLFGQLDITEKRQLEALTLKRTFEKGQLLFREGDPATMVLLVTCGRVKLFKVSAEGKEVILGYLSAHDLLGEEILFRDGVRSFSAQAVERTAVCACAKADFEKLAGAHPSISAKVARTLGEKLSQMADQLADIAMYDVRDRLIRLLARLAREQAVSGPAGWTLDRHVTHEDLGALVGASRVMVTNVLLALREADLLTVDPQRRLVIHQRLLDSATAIPESAGATDRGCACFIQLRQSGAKPLVRA